MSARSLTLRSAITVALAVAAAAPPQPSAVAIQAAVISLGTALLPALVILVEILIPMAALLGLLLLWQLNARRKAALARMAEINAALRESETRYRTIADLTTDTIYSLQLGDQGQVELEWISESFTSTTGYTQEDLREHDRWLSILHPDDIDIDRRHGAALFGGHSDVCEYRIRTKHGQVRWLRDYARPIWDAQHTRIVRIVGAAQDITDRKQAEATQLFLAEASGMLVSSLDYETTLVHVARLAIPRLADWCMIHLIEPGSQIRRVVLTFADLAKQPLADELQRDYPLDPSALHSYPRVIRTGQPELIAEIDDDGLRAFARDARHLELLQALGFCSTISVPLIARDRTIGSITLGTAETGRHYNSADLQIAEELAGRVALAVDNAWLFDERTATADRLRRQNEELQALHDVTLGLIDRLDIDSLLGALVIRAGALLETAHGYLYVHDPSSDELVVRVGTGIFADQVGYRLQRGQGLAGQTWATGKTQSIDNYSAWPQRRLDIDNLGLRAIANVPVRAGADFVGVLGLVYVEAQRTFSAVELTLLERFADLASLALENARLYSAAQQELAERRRTEAALRSAEADLRAAKEQAEAATRAKSAFLAQMSHDMRTPISSALGIAGLLGHTALDSDQRELVDMIRASGDTLLALLNNFLDLAKIEAGGLTLDRDPFVLQSCIENAIDLVASKLVAKDLDMAYLLDPRVPASLLGDQHRLGQILLNLLSNAATFTHHGGVLLTVTAQPAEEAHYEIHFSVADTGVGILPAQQEQVFIAFQQIRGPNAQLSSGTGLGLAIAKQLSELMGGRMWVDSTVGIGSTFHFTIVVDAVPEQPEQLSAAGALLAGKQMLIVDRHAQSRQALSAYARALDMHVIAAGSAQAALAVHALDRPIDVVIADIREANGDQAALVAQLRAHFGLPELPVILLAPLGLHDTRMLAEQHDHILRKPIKPSQLRALLLRLLGHRPHVGAAESAAAAAAAHDGVAAPPIEHDADERAEPTRLHSAPALGSPSILLAEDDHANQLLGMRILQRLGYAHTAVSTGAQAIAALDRQRYDVVLLDIQMPDMDGLAAARLIRQRRPGEPQPYLIAITAATSADVQEQCRRAGIDDYLVKPLELSELQAALARYSTSTSAPIAHPAPPHHPPETFAAAGVAAASQPLDGASLDRIRLLFGNQQDKLHALFASYSEDATKLLAKMHAASAARDPHLLRQALHQLKSGSAIVTALPLANLCTQFEHALSISEATDWQAWIAGIEAELADVQSALKHESLC